MQTKDLTSEQLLAIRNVIYNVETHIIGGVANLEDAQMLRLSAAELIHIAQELQETYY